MKIMLSAVGNRDPYAADKNTGELSDGPLLTVARHVQPDIIIMFPTREQSNEKLSFTEDRCEEIRTVIQQECSMVKKVTKIALDLPDPTDHHNILVQVGQEIEKIKEQYKHSQPGYLISVSSGTPQLQACFLILVNTRKIDARIFQARDPYYVEAGQERVREIDIQFLEEENQIRRAQLFYENGNFTAASDELTQLSLATRSPDREKKAELFSELIQSYNYVDLYQHDRAKKLLDPIADKVSQYHWDTLHGYILDQQKAVNEIIALGETEGWTNLCDLYHNADRRFRGEQFVDCLSRFKRIYEGCYFYVARQELGVRYPGNSIDKQPDWVRQRVGRVNGYVNIYDWANLYENKKGRRLIGTQLEGQLSELANTRNTTINNHGMKSVDRKQASDSLKLAEKLLEQVFPNAKVQAYPFSAVMLNEVKELIFQVL